MSSCSKEDGDDLPMDILYEIFIRLPLKPVYKFRCVSKLWNSLLSNTSLVNEVFKRITTSPPWTIVYDRSEGLTPQVHQTYSPDLHYNFINDHDGFSFQFLLDNTHTYPDRAYLIDSSVNGLVLCRKEGCKSFNVCNPLTKQYVTLPPVSSTNYFCIRLVSETSTTSNYKVVCSGHRSDSCTTTFQVFSSDTGEWRTHQVHGDGNFIGYMSHMVIHNGVLYWTDYREYRPGMKMVVRAFNLENRKLSKNTLWLINLPEDITTYFSGGFFGVSEGSMYYGHVNHTTDNMSGFLSVWLLEDYYSNGGWVWQPVCINIEMKGHSLFKDMSGVSCCFNPEDRNVVIFAGRYFCLAYNIGTRTYEVLRGSPSPSYLEKGTYLEKRPTRPWVYLVTPKPTRIHVLSPS